MYEKTIVSSLNKFHSRGKPFPSIHRHQISSLFRPRRCISRRTILKARKEAKTCMNNETVLSLIVSLFSKSSEFDSNLNDVV